MATPADTFHYSLPSPQLLVVATEPDTLQLLCGLAGGLAGRVRQAQTVDSAMACQQAQPADLVLFDEAVPIAPAFRRLPGRPPLLVALTEQAGPGLVDDSELPDAYLEQPLQMPAARQRIGELLRLRESIETIHEAENLLVQVAETVERRVPNIGNHCRRMADGVEELGRALSLNAADLHVLRRAAYLHDVGKLYTPDAILFKPGALTDSERLTMQQHVLHGEEICRPVRTLAPVLPAIRHHHERWDGSGYPDHLSGRQIPLFARIVQVVDIFDSLTHARPYQPALPINQALEILLAEARSGWRDPELVRIFLKLRRPH